MRWHAPSPVDIALVGGCGEHDDLTAFQKGALEYVRTHGLACVRLVDDAWTYEDP